MPGSNPARQLTSPENLEAIAETITGLIDRNGFDAWAEIEIEDSAAKTEFRDPATGIVYELAVTPLRIDQRKL